MDSEYDAREDDAQWCDCCPHAVRGAETLASLMHHLEGALKRQVHLTDVAEAASEEAARLRKECAEQELMLEQFAIEVYDLKQKLAAAQQQVASVYGKHAETQRFLAALGYSRKLATSEDS